MKKIINFKYKVISLVKIFIQKERKADFISEAKEIGEEKQNPFIRFLDSYLVCLSVKVANREVIHYV